MSPLARAVSVLLAGCALYGIESCSVRAQEIAPAPKVGCPPEDGYDWIPKARPVDRVLWVQVRDWRQFEALCRPGDSACTWTFEGIAIVFSPSPQWAYSEGFQLHEKCHAAWVHGPAPITSLYR